MFTGLRTQILFLALLPPLIIALSLGIYLSYSRTQDLQYFSEARGKSLLLELGNNAQYAIENNIPGLLQKIGNSSLEENGVRAVTFFDPEGRVLAHSGPSLHLQLKPQHFSLPSITQIHDKNIISFISPIKTQSFTSTIQENSNDNNHVVGWVAVEYNQDSIIIKTHQQLFTQNLLLLAGLLLSALIGLKLGQRINNDIKSINNTIKKIKEGGSTHHLDVSSSKELRTLASNIEDMAAHLKNEFDELRHNVEITTNDLKETIETIEIQNIELNLAKKEALTASKIKSEFLANTSHEIRTPLNGIIGFTKILKKTVLNTQQNEYVDTIQQSSENLLAIMNDILDFSKIEAGKLELEVAPFNIRHVFEECVNLFAPYAYDKNIEIVLLIYQDVPNNVTGDSMRIKQIVSNLLSNAVKFTHQGTIAIRVSLESMTQDNIELCISVSDTGVGMTALQQKNIFQAFTQANSSISREYGGTGLGLAIVKKLVELMHDDIKVESIPNEGSTFSFILKTRIAEHQESLAYDKLEGKTMLIIEKHALLNLSIKHLLNTHGINALTATSIEDASQLLSEYYVDVIIYGFSPVYSHETQLTEVKILEKHSRPLLLLTSTNAEKDIHGLYSESITIGYKPITEARLYLSLYDIFHPRKTHSQQPVVEHVRHKPLDVLAVDDHPANLKLLNVFLAHIGCNISNARDGQEAIDLCQKKTFDIIFMDIQMPIINGLNATKYIREEISNNKNTPIIALTAHAMADEKETILQVGMNDYITKPINENQLKATIDKWCVLSAETTKPEFIDIHLCLKLSSYKHDLAIEMFTMLVDSLADDIQEIQTALISEDFSNMLEFVHKLHGACCYTGVPELKSAAQRLEYAIKNNDTEQFCTLFNALNDAAKAIIQWSKHNQFEQLISS